jgi:hypothetical protein
VEGGRRDLLAAGGSGWTTVPVAVEQQDPGDTQLGAQVIQDL